MRTKRAFNYTDSVSALDGIDDSPGVIPSTTFAKDIITTMTMTGDLAVGDFSIA